LNLKSVFAHLLTICLVSPLALHGQRQQRAFKAGVRFLATSTSVRSGTGENQDVYLVEITLPGRADEVGVGRLVDEYPPYRAAIPSTTLVSAVGGTFRLRRDRECDVTFARMPLRTFPGDPMAILADPLGYSPTLPRPVSATELLPCYRTIRPAN
jgi:hypothetical protein